MKVNRQHHSTGRKLAAIMLTDIAGYTALMQKDEQTAFTYLRHFQKEMKEKVAGHSSRILNFYEMKRLAFLKITERNLKLAITNQQSFHNQDDPTHKVKC